jgi:hypothetical protein
VFDTLALLDAAPLHNLEERPSGGHIMLIRFLSATAACAALTITPMAPANAATQTYPAGVACDFELRVDATGGPQVNKMFETPDGSVRILSAGAGSDLVFTNLDSGATYSLSGRGTVSWTRVDAAGSARLTVTGHRVMIYFPTDTPAGPSTTLVVGREDIALDLDTFEFTRLSRTGKTTDICAALS